MKPGPILLLVVTLALAGCGKIEVRGKDEATLNAAEKRATTQRLRRACASSITYDRLKDLAFDHAKARGGNAAQLDRVAAASIVRMESPVAKSRDDKLNMTLCTGRLVLQLPPDVGGGRSLAADVEYSAQEALDGTGPVYRIKGAEPIVEALAALDLKGDVVRTAASPTPRPVASRTPVATAPRTDPPSGASARPGYDCAAARSRVEQMICGSERLAERDRKMSARYRAAWAEADASTRADLAETGRRFLRFRDRCPDERCVARAYSDRIDEIKDIARGRY